CRWLAMKSTSAGKQRARSGAEPAMSAAGPHASMRTRSPSIRASAIQIAWPALSAPLKSMPMIRSAIGQLAEQFESRFKRCEPDRSAVAVELMTLDQRLAPFSLAGEIDEADRLRRRRAGRTGDTGHRHRHVGMGAGQGPFGHGARHVRTDGS